jgi:hypothetical protein
MDLESRSAFVLSILAAFVVGAYLGSQRYAKGPHDGAGEEAEFRQLDAMIPMRDG